MDEQDLAPTIFEYAELDGERLTGQLCTACQARGRHCEKIQPGLHNVVPCLACAGAGCLDVIPELPTIAPPGSMEKVIVMGARYEAGLPIFDRDDETTMRPGNWRIIRESKKSCRFLPLSVTTTESFEDAPDDFDDLCD